MAGSYRYLFGPVPSRRFGRSLGVDLTPYKTCSLDCVFCQLGRTQQKTVARKEYVPTDAVVEELGHWLRRGGRADYITLAGSGEPSLHSRFGEVLAYIRAHSSIPAVLLTNGTMLHLSEVRDTAAQANVVKVSLSAWDQSSFGSVNRPHDSLRLDTVIRGQMAFRAEFKGALWLEVFLVPGINSLRSDLRKIAALAQQIRPDRIHLNTAVRPPAEDFVAPLSREDLESRAALFSPKAEIIADFIADPSHGRRANEDTIVAMLERRPCTAQEIAQVYGMHRNEVAKYLGILLRTGRISAQSTNKSIYYVVKGGKTNSTPGS
ncbi:MAG: radical SAM protein [Deltaproteobacteria bacterium]|nr:radical SAM protein [Deltaproteobacteria bacterium]